MACYPNKMPPGRIDVRSERGSYPVVIGAGEVARLPTLLADLGLQGNALVVSSEPIWRAQGRHLRSLIGRRPPLLLPDGERAKSLATAAAIYDTLVARRMDRSAALVAFGGGVVGDVAGFAAATYLRGIRVIQVPTTLLAQVDSAIGGKVAVNLPAGKNLVGAFHPPSLVLCDPALLDTLPAREFRAGLYEVVKYGVIASAALFTRIQDRLDGILARDPADLTPVVTDCCRIKADVVGGDEREAGPRRVLNFGHTIGHALEAVTQYRRFRHGEAVAYGMLAAARMSAARGLLPVADETQIQAIVTRLGKLPPVADLRIDDALERVGHDKKVVQGRLHMVLTAGIGRTVIVDDVSRAELRGAMRAIGLTR